MKLYIRTQESGERREHVQFDQCFDMTSQAQWRARINAVGSRIVTSVLKPTGERFRLTGKHLYTKSHPHETHYVYDAAIHESYRTAAEKLAARIEAAIAGAKRCLVYLPLRGAPNLACQYADTSKRLLRRAARRVSRGYVKFRDVP